MRRSWVAHLSRGAKNGAFEVEGLDEHLRSIFPGASSIVDSGLPRSGQDRLGALCACGTWGHSNNLHILCALRVSVIFVLILSFLTVSTPPCACGSASRARRLLLPALPDSASSSQGFT
jgi:hypothetical protein